MARNPAERATSSVMGSLDPRIDKFTKAVTSAVNRGMSVEAAADYAATTTKIGEEIKKAVLREVARIAGSAANDAPGFRQWWLNKVWAGEKMSLSAKVNDLARLTETKETIRVAMKNAQSWNSIATSLQQADLTKADLPAHLTALQRAVKRLTAGDPVAQRQYVSALKRSMAQVERLAKGGAPTSRLKKAYENVIKVSQSGSQKAMERAIERSVRAKMQYNAERIARTETARAYAQQTYSDVLSDEQVVAIGYDLNDGHPKPDICDFHTGADLYGLGPGVYPLSNLPPYPFHPNCICTLYNVYSGEAKPLDPKKAEAFLRKQPAEVRRDLMGKDGARTFEKNPNSWSDVLKNYVGHENIGDLVEI